MTQHTKASASAAANRTTPAAYSSIRIACIVTKPSSVCLPRTIPESDQPPTVTWGNAIESLVSDGAYTPTHSTCQNPGPRLINSFTRVIYPRKAECRFAVAAAQHLDERVQVQLIGTASAVDHFDLDAQLSRVDFTHVRLTIGSSLVVEIAQGRKWRVAGTTAKNAELALCEGFKDATGDCGALAVAAAFVDEADAVYSVRTSPLRSVPPTV
jgi:hypothetical protein